MSFPICETCEQYEPIIDIKNQCFRDLNLSEIKIKYGPEKTFRCCGVDYTPKKRYQFISSHISSRKHQNFIGIENEKYKQMCGPFTDTTDQISSMMKTIRDLKSQLYHKNEESKFNAQEINKLNITITDLHKEIVRINDKEQNRRRKLKVVPVRNLIDL